MSPICIMCEWCMYLFVHFLPILCAPFPHLSSPPPPLLPPSFLTLLSPTTHSPPCNGAFALPPPQLHLLLLYLFVPPPPPFPPPCSLWFWLQSYLHWGYSGHQRGDTALCLCCHASGMCACQATWRGQWISACSIERLLLGYFVFVFVFCSVHPMHKRVVPIVLLLLALMSSTARLALHPRNNFLVHLCCSKNLM